MIEEPIHVTDAAFQKTVIENTLPVIVDFWAPWVVLAEWLPRSWIKLPRKTLANCL
jgi:thioredoxin-like negative regulator of GroEL